MARAAAIKVAKVAPTVKMPSVKMGKAFSLKTSNVPAAKIAADPLVKSKLAKAPKNTNKSSSKVGNTSILPKNAGML